MKIGGVHYRTIWRGQTGGVWIIDQTTLPHIFAHARLATLDDAAQAITTMQVRGAPLIGITAAYGLCFALEQDASDAALEQACETLAATRPTAVNLRWALGQMRQALKQVPPAERAQAAYAKAGQLADEDVETCRLIGHHGRKVIAEIAARKDGRVNVLTHCNAGWLACVDWGTALAPIYQAHDAGMPSMSGWTRPGRATRAPR